MFELKKPLDSGSDHSCRQSNDNNHNNVGEYKANRDKKVSISSKSGKLSALTQDGSPLERISDRNHLFEMKKSSPLKKDANKESNINEDEFSINGDVNKKSEQDFGKNQPMLVSSPLCGLSATSKGENCRTRDGPAKVVLPPPPVLKGTLSYSIELRRHVIRGMWNYESSNAFPPQRFELIRNLNAGEDPTDLPKNGEFHGSFSLAYFHTTSKGKKKERSKVIPESGVNIKFTKLDRRDKEFKVDGQGKNQFGIFNINGKVTPSAHDGDQSYNIELRKRYAPSQSTGLAVASGSRFVSSVETKRVKKSKKRKRAITGDTSHVGGDQDSGQLPAPSRVQEGMVCLRGKLCCDQSGELGGTNDVHRISGVWSSGISNIIEDHQNARGFCNRFEYEHKSSVPSDTFPQSGRYTGWFDLTQENGHKSRILETDITLKFRQNNEGFHNIEGRGSNNFGKYKITGTLTNDNTVTIFRHFYPLKLKSRDDIILRTIDPVTAVPPPLQIQRASEIGKQRSILSSAEPLLKLNEVVIHEDINSEVPEPILPPSDNAYSAVSRGVLSLNDSDGTHTCSGKWAITREDFNNGQTSNFHFRLESHLATVANTGENLQYKQDSRHSSVSSNESAPELSHAFPVDSAMYKGTFQMRRGASKSQTIIDQQIALKFRKNVTGSYNVYGKGINKIGKFDLVGSLIVTGKKSGHVELYRIYFPFASGQATIAGDSAKLQSLFSLDAGVIKKTVTIGNHGNDMSFAHSRSRPAEETCRIAPALPSVPANRFSPPALTRRESFRTVKLPSRLEDGDPQPQLNGIMEKCRQHLQFLKEKDVASGAFFSEPVDPVAHGVPSYHDVISEPMDLGTIQKKLDAGEINSPEYFGRLVRLVFENAMTFNVEPTHLVHQTSRNLLILFNQKFRETEIKVEQMRRNQKLSEAEFKKVPDRAQKEREELKRAKKKKGDERKKLGRGARNVTLEDAEVIAATHTRSVAAIEAASPPSSRPETVTRVEFNLMLEVVQQLQCQVVQLHRFLAKAQNLLHTRQSWTGTDSLDAKVTTGSVTLATSSEKITRKFASVVKSDENNKEMEAVNELKGLTLKEQGLLTDTINKLSPGALPGVIQIIRASTQLGDYDDEIDLEIDQLNTATQRKLQHYVKKHARLRRKQKAKKAPQKLKGIHLLSEMQQTKNDQTAAIHFSVLASSATDTLKQPSSVSGSFLALRNDSGNADSDCDSTNFFATRSQQVSKEIHCSTANDDLRFESGLQYDNDDDINDLNFATKWNMSNADELVSTKPKIICKDGRGSGTDLWGAAADKAAVSKQREAERKALKDKMIADVELAKRERLEAAAAKKKEILLKRMKDEAIESCVQEQQVRDTKEAQKAARDAAHAQVQSVEQTVDLDAQRDIMKQYEQSFLDMEQGGSASPSSDYGF